MMDLLVASNYLFNPYAIPPILTAVALQGLALFVVSYERGTRASWTFFLMCSVVNIWLASSGIMYLSVTEPTALFWGYVMHTAVSFIPAALYNFTITITKTTGIKKKIIPYTWLISLGFTLTPLVTSTAMENVYNYSWGFYPDFESMELVYLGYFALLLTVNLQIYWRNWRNETKKPVARKRMLTFLLGFGMAYFASIDILPAFGYSVFPSGYLFVLSFCFIVALGIWRYRLVDFTPAFIANETLHTMNDPLIVCDIDGTVKMINDACQKILGYGDEDLVGRSIKTIYSRNDQAEKFMENLRKMNNISDVQTLITKNGETLEVDISSTLLTDQEGNFVGCVVVVRDLSEIIQERKKIDLLQDISASANEVNKVTEALDSTLPKVCIFLNFDLAHAFYQESPESSVFHSTGQLYGQDTEDVQWFLEKSTDYDVLEDPEISTVRNDHSLRRFEDLRDLQIDRYSALTENNFQSGCLVPIVVDGDMVGILEFFSRESLSLTSTKQEVLRYTAEQLARVIERERAETVEKAFRHYVPSSVMKRAIENPDSLELGGTRREITVLYADLAKFTNFSQNRSAKEVAYVLNRVLTQITECIFDHQGILDKYIGDALLAEFGILPQFEPKKHPRRACLAALDMMKAMDELHEEWEDDKKQLNLKLGVHTGNAATGNMGSEVLFDFTAVGDTMNTGARLEQVNKKFGTSCLISSETYEEVKDFIQARCLGHITFEGRDEPITIYELVGKKETIEETTRTRIKTFEQALEYYRNRKWNEAWEVFNELSREDSQDTPTEYYREKTKQYLESPPSPEWSPVETL